MMVRTLVLVAWIMWHGTVVSGLRGDRQEFWDIGTAFETREECREDIPFRNYVVSYALDGSRIKTTMYCFPETFDPRGSARQIDTRNP